MDGVSAVHLGMRPTRERCGWALHEMQRRRMSAETYVYSDACVWFSGCAETMQDMCRNLGRRAAEALVVPGRADAMTGRHIFSGSSFRKLAGYARHGERPMAHRFQHHALPLRNHEERAGYHRAGSSHLPKCQRRPGSGTRQPCRHSAGSYIIPKSVYWTVVAPIPGRHVGKIWLAPKAMFARAADSRMGFGIKVTARRRNEG